MLIIIEGIDMVGKTTLAKKLEEQGFIYCKWFNMDGPIKNGINVAFNSLVSDLFKYVDFKNKDVVIDRFHLTEYVYGSLERNHSGKEDCLAIDKKLQILGEDFLLVYVKPEDLNFSSALHKKDLSEHSRLFDEIIKETKCKHIATSWGQLDKTVEEIKAYKERRKSNEEY